MHDQHFERVESFGSFLNVVRQTPSKLKHARRGGAAAAARRPCAADRIMLQGTFRV